MLPKVCERDSIESLLIVSRDCVYVESFRRTNNVNNNNNNNNSRVLERPFFKGAIGAYIDQGKRKTIAIVLTHSEA